MSHSQQVLRRWAQEKQQTVCPQGQKVAPIGFCLQSRQVMALRSRCSSPSSSLVRWRTDVASNEKTLSPDIGSIPLDGLGTPSGRGVKDSGVECWSGSTSE